MGMQFPGNDNDPKDLPFVSYKWPLNFKTKEIY